MVDAGALAATTAAIAQAEQIEKTNKTFAGYEPRGWTVRPGKLSWVHTIDPTMHGVVDQQLVSVQYLADSNVVIAVTDAVVHNGGHLEVHSAGIVSRLARLFGGGRVTTGNEAFDRKYTIESSPETFAKALLDARTCETLIALDARRFAYDDAKLVLVERSGEPTPAAIDLMIDLVATVARNAPRAGAYR